MIFKFSIGEIKYGEISVDWVELGFGRQQTIVIYKMCSLLLSPFPQEPSFGPIGGEIVEGVTTPT